MDHRRQALLGRIPFSGKLSKGPFIDLIFRKIYLIIMVSLKAMINF